MNISLISVKESEINFLSQLKKYISSKIINVNVSITIVDSVLDLPKKLHEQENTDLIFVCYYYAEDSNEIKVMLEKLVDFEIKTGKSIVKAIKKQKEDDINEDEQELAERFGKMIVKKLIGIEPE